jgi:hypothetical protein
MLGHCVPQGHRFGLTTTALSGLGEARRLSHTWLRCQGKLYQPETPCFWACSLRPAAFVFHRRSDRRASRGVADKIGLAVGALLGRRKVAKHFRITIANDALSFTRDHAAIATEAALDGFYVLRTNVPADALDAAEQCAPFLMSRVCCMSCARLCPTFPQYLFSRSSPRRRRFRPVHDREQQREAQG